MGRHFDASPRKILEVKMRALEAQFARPVFSETDYHLKRQTEIALGEVYKEIMRQANRKEDKSLRQVYREIMKKTTKQLENHESRN